MYVNSEMDTRASAGSTRKGSEVPPLCDVAKRGFYAAVPPQFESTSREEADGTLMNISARELASSAVRNQLVEAVIEWRIVGKREIIRFLLVSTHAPTCERPLANAP